MQIIDVLKDGAQLLGLTEEVEILNKTTEETQSDSLENNNIKELFHLVKFSIQELCSNYVPIVNMEEIDVQNLKYELKSLTNFIKLKKITKGEERADYKLMNRTLHFKENGTYSVYFETYPTISSMFDEVDFLSHLSPDVIVFGLCSYYCLSKGLFEDFNMFHDKYIERAESLKDMKTFFLPTRRWE
ncbi:MAG: hypothetical protein IKA36_02790 [Clostridia bacterium]|nr:hypothetical protein [Clostridia bacterium]